MGGGGNGTWEGFLCGRKMQVAFVWQLVSLVTLRDFVSSAPKSAHWPESIT